MKWTSMKPRLTLRWKDNQTFALERATSNRQQMTMMRRVIAPSPTRRSFLRNHTDSDRRHRHIRGCIRRRFGFCTGHPGPRSPKDRAFRYQGAPYCSLALAQVTEHPVEHHAALSAARPGRSGGEYHADNGPAGFDGVCGQNLLDKFATDLREDLADLS